MRRIWLAWLAVAGCAHAPGGALAPGDHDISLSHDGRTRHYLVHLPAKTGALPVILSFHGGGGDARGQMDWTAMNSLSDAEGFVVVYPEGTPPIGGGRKLLTWNAGFCCGVAARDGVDDVGFVVAVLEDLAARGPVDRTRVYATGMSNGAMMVYKLARELPRRLAAVAPVAGATDLRPAAGAPAVPVMHFHSVDDPRALYGGGLGPPFPFTKSRVDHPPVEKAVRGWAADFGCAPEPVTGETLTGQGGDAGHTATKLTWSGCRDGAEVVLWKLGGSGHVWPGARRTSLRQLLGESTQVIDANREMWAFFRRYARPDAPALATGSVSGEARPLAAADGAAERAALLDGLLDQAGGAVGAEGAPSSDLPDMPGAGVYRPGSLWLRGALGVGQTSLLHARLKLERPLNDRTVTEASVGLLVGTKLGPRDILLFDGTLALAESEDTFSDPRPYPLAAAAAVHRFDSFLLAYGVAYADVFGRRGVLPIVGASAKLGARWRVTALLPVTAQLSFRARDRLSLELRLGPMGDRFRALVGGSAVAVSARGVRLGLAAKWRLQAAWHVSAEIGVEGVRRLSYSDGDTSLAEQDLPGTAYLRLALEVALGG